MSNDIEGKVVVITGASSGLGEATARLLCAQGASVVLGARRIDRIQSLADELTGSGGKALAITTDVTFVEADYDRRSDRRRVPHQVPPLRREHHQPHREP
jgi:NADP-dependent 3-hydroxy acid dehydrogenase YdfG